ncbi:MAG: signal peptidase I [Actinobacteria bacterium]|nr:signal peptidase I [Actinomycetota bacterium]
MHNKRARKLAKVLGWMATITLFGILLLTSFLMIAPLFGMQAYTVLSGSMEPALKVGGITVCKSVPVESIKVGDIIAFNSLEGVKVTHRVISVADEGGTLMFRTKGDANEEPDPDEFSISGNTVHKVVFHIPYLGYVYNFIRNKLVFITIIMGSALLLLAILGKEMRATLSEFRSRRKDVSTGASMPDSDGAGKQ